jgi:DNA-binding NarL/FixJ family response regulator
MSITGEEITIVASDATPMGCHLLAEALERSCVRFKLVGCANNCEQIMEAARKDPSVILISASLREGPLHGFKALREIRDLFPTLRAVMLLDNREREQVIAAFRGGAKGVFFRAENFASLVKCIECVHEGQIWVQNSDLQLILETLTAAAPLKAINGNPAVLSRREQQIATFVAQGFTNREISRKLNLSEHTVKNSLSRIFEKLGISNRVELVIQLRNGKSQGAA